MRKAVALLVIGLVLALGFPGPAWAKGAESVTISGGDLDEAIVVPLMEPGSRADGPPPYLVAALTSLADPLYVSTATDVATESGIGVSAADLDHYTLTWHMADGQATIVQDVYPDLGTGPMIHTHPSAYLDGKSGWYQAPEALRDTLAALGAPIAGLTTGLPTATKTVTRPSDSTDSPAAPLWALPVPAVAGLALGVGLGSRRFARRARPAPELVLGSG